MTAPTIQQMIEGIRRHLNACDMLFAKDFRMLAANVIAKESLSSILSIHTANLAPEGVKSAEFWTSEYNAYDRGDKEFYEQWFPDLIRRIQADALASRAAEPQPLNGRGKVLDESDYVAMTKVIYNTIKAAPKYVDGIASWDEAWKIGASALRTGMETAVRNAMKAPPPLKEGELEAVKHRIAIRMNNHLCEMKPEFDDSITGFNKAWDIVDRFLDEEIGKSKLPYPDMIKMQEVLKEAIIIMELSCKRFDAVNITHTGLDRRIAQCKEALVVLHNSTPKDDPRLFVVTETLRQIVHAHKTLEDTDIDWNEIIMDADRVLHSVGSISTDEIRNAALEEAAALCMDKNGGRIYANAIRSLIVKYNVCNWPVCGCEPQCKFYKSPAPKAGKGISDA